MKKLIRMKEREEIVNERKRKQRNNKMEKKEETEERKEKRWNINGGEKRNGMKRKKIE